MTTPPIMLRPNPALQAPPNTVYVSFSAEIIPHTTESLIATITNLTNQGVKQIYLMLSTPGGSVMHGMNIYNVLRALPIELITHNVGNVDSIGNAVFLAGSKRYACPHSTFMFHGVGFDVPQQTRIEEKFLRERLDGIVSDQKRIGSVIEDRTQISREDIAKLFLEAQTKDAAFAASCGIIDEIRDVQIPQGAPVYSLVFQRQATGV
jgi:ATP-dependent Clp protease, protease subunit